MDDLIIVVAGGVVLALIVYQSYMINDYREQAIQHSCAKYSETSGAFEWK